MYPRYNLIGQAFLDPSIRVQARPFDVRSAPRPFDPIRPPPPPPAPRPTNARFVRFGGIGGREVPMWTSLNNPSRQGSTSFRPVPRGAMVTFAGQTDVESFGNTFAPRERRPAKGEYTLVRYGGAIGWILTDELLEGPSEGGLIPPTTGQGLFRTFPGGLGSPVVTVPPLAVQLPDVPLRVSPPVAVQQRPPGFAVPAERRFVRLLSTPTTELYTGPSSRTKKLADVRDGAPVDAFPPAVIEPGSRVLTPSGVSEISWFHVRVPELGLSGFIRADYTTAVPPRTGAAFSAIGQAGSSYARCGGRKCSVYGARPYLARGIPQVPKNPIIDLLQGTRVRVIRRTILPGYVPPNLASWRRWTLVQIGNIRGWVWDLGLTPEK